MTTPSLGDLTQIPVTLRPTQGLPALGDTTVTLYNQDITNVVYASYQQWFTPGAGNSIPIQPLGSITISAKRAIYVAALVSVAALLVLPEGSAVQPSPAQIAAQINALGLAKETTQLAGNTLITGVNTTLGAPAQDSIRTAIPNNIASTGVPLLNLRSALISVSGQVITAGATFSPAIITGITQPTYNLHIEPTAGAGTYPFLSVVLQWVDSVSGLIVQVDSYITSMSATAGALKTVIYGPTDADELQISITNLDTVSCTIAQLFATASSRPNITEDRCYQYWTTAAMPGVQGYQLSGGQRLPTGRILFSLTRSVTNGVTTSPDYIMPLWAGPVFISFIGTSSNSWKILFTDTATLVNIFRIDVTAGNSNLIAYLPRAPVSLNISNTGSVVSVLNMEVIAV